MKRGPQSVQSVPYAQVPPVTPGSQDGASPSHPSWQKPLLPYGPPRPRSCGRHSSEHSMGGGDDGGGVGGGGGESGGGTGGGGGVDGGDGGDGGGAGGAGGAGGGGDGGR